MVSQFYGPIVGGQERMVEDLAVALVRRDHDVAVATQALDGKASTTTERGVRVHRVRTTFQRLGRTAFAERSRPHTPPVADPEASAALRRVVAEERPDVLHAHDWFVRSVVPVARQTGTPLVLTLHDHSLVCATKRLMRYDERVCEGPSPLACAACASKRYGALRGLPIAAALRVLHPQVTSTVDRFLPVSAAVATASRLDEHALGFEVVPNFLADPDPGGGHVPPVDLELPAPGFVAFVGDATTDKGAAVLLEAHRRLGAGAALQSRWHGARPTLVFVGRPSLPELAPPPADVVVLGPQPHDVVLEVLRRAAVTAVPSLLVEAFGLAALESLGVGTPVVASHTGGLVDVVEHGVSGLLVPPGDITALAAALEEVLADDRRRSSMGRAAAARAATFSEAVIVERIERIYEEVASRSGVATRQGNRG